MFPSTSTHHDYNKLVYVPNPDFNPRPAPAQIERLMQKIKDELPSDFDRKFHWNLNRNQRLLLRTIRHQNHLKILNTDKNLGPAVMTMDQYKSFCLEHLNDRGTYRRIEVIPMEQTIRRIKQFHQELVCAFPYEQKNAKIIVHQLEASTPAYFHGIPKIHKTPMGCRPIVSNVNAPTNGLSKWLTFKLLPLTRRIHSYLRDSSDLQRTVTTLKCIPNGIFYTLDVEQMYTSIPVQEAIKAIQWFLSIAGEPMIDAILQGLLIVMSENYFSFGDTFWQQLQGLAMGTPVAPVLATLYLGYYEETKIIPQFKSSLYLYKRYLDDILIIWDNSQSDTYAWNRFRAILRQVPGLSWTHSTHQEEVNFLDLWIYRDTECYGSRTHQKLLNLYLYPTFNSAHPPGVQKGLIFGLLLKYKQQNTRYSDFLQIAKLLFQRLLLRGFKLDTLRRIFREMLEKLNNPPSRKRTHEEMERQFFFKVPYDPNGPSRQELRTLFQLDSLSEALSTQRNGRITVCYMKPRNLGNLLMRTQLKPTTPAPAEEVQDVRSINPNP